MNLGHKNILIIKLNNNEFEQFYNKKIAEFGIDVWDIESLRTHKTKQPIRNMLSSMRCFWDKEIRNSISKYDHIIIFEDQGLVPIISLIKRKKANIILWNWNIMPFKKAKRENMFFRLCQIWTFDKSDARKYGWKFNEQFYFRPENVRKVKNNIPIAFCACADKNRYTIMKKIYDELEKENIICDFYCVKDKDKKYEVEDQFLIDEPLGYEMFLKHVENSDIVVDVVQKGQTGLTVRVLEALFYNKKLITNNKSIINMPFYNSYIYIYGEENKISFSEFLKLKDCIYNEKVKQIYTFEQWIQKLCE